MIAIAQSFSVRVVARERFWEWMTDLFLPYYLLFHISFGEGFSSSLKKPVGATGWSSRAREVEEGAPLDLIDEGYVFVDLLRRYAISSALQSTSGSEPMTRQYRGRSVFTEP